MTNAAWYRVTPVTGEHVGTPFMVLVVMSRVAACAYSGLQVGDEWRPLLSLFAGRKWPVEELTHV